MQLATFESRVFQLDALQISPHGQMIYTHCLIRFVKRTEGCQSAFTWSNQVLCQTCSLDFFFLKGQGPSQGSNTGYGISNYVFKHPSITRLTFPWRVLNHLIALDQLTAYYVLQFCFRYNVWDDLVPYLGSLFKRICHANELCITKPCSKET